MNFALEAVRGLKACWRLVCMDEGGLDDLDLGGRGASPPLRRGRDSDVTRVKSP